MAATPHDLPLLYVAGDADPVGKCGRAVAAAAESMEAAGAEDLTLRLVSRACAMKFSTNSAKKKSTISS